MEEKYILRLIKFGNHLKHIKTDEEDLILEHFHRDFKNKKFDCEVSLNLIYLRQLSVVFTDLWIDINPYSEHFGPVYVAQTDLGIVAGLGKFFNVDCETTRHLFDITGKQNIKRWGGQRLYYNSTGKDYAKNIFEYVERKNK